MKFSQKDVSFLLANILLLKQCALILFEAQLS